MSIRSVISNFVLIFGAGLLSGTVSLHAQQAKQVVDHTSDDHNRDSASVSVIQDEPEDLALRVLVADENEGPAFAKRHLNTVQPLTTEELAKVNPQAIEQDVTIPLRGYPDPSQAPVPNKPLYAEASLGLFMTGALHAGYSGSIWPYDFSARIDAETTQGFVENADASLLNGEFSGGYIIGDDYGMFSGGYMGVEGGYLKQDYRLYALDIAPQRLLSNWYIGMKGSNTYNDISYDAKGRYRDITLVERDSITGTPDAYERAFEGSLELSTMWSGLKWSGTADMSLSSYTGESISYGRFSGYAEFSK